MVNVISAKIKELYSTFNQLVYGPGVGAASFSTKEDKVIFIHGIRNASAKNPYSFTRRTWVSIELTHPLLPIFMDARDVFNPFTPGALRVGVHMLIPGVEMASGSVLPIMISLWNNLVKQMFI